MSLIGYNLESFTHGILSHELFPWNHWRLSVFARSSPLGHPFPFYDFLSMSMSVFEILFWVEIIGGREVLPGVPLYFWPFCPWIPLRLGTTRST